jgi:hypothetical protein
MSSVTPNITPTVVAIKALEIWNSSQSADAVTKGIKQFLESEIGMEPDAANALAGEAVPIYNTLRLALNPQLTTSFPAPTQPEVPVNALSTYRHQRPRFPDPEPFDGTRSLYPVFKQKARAKINIDGAIYGSEAGQVDYLFNRLTGPAAKCVLPWLNAGSATKMTLDTFWNFMDSRFSDPQAKAKALDRLQSMKQKGSEDVRDYLARFESELLESEVIMDNAVKISTFTRGLRTQVQRDIAMIDNTTSFETFCHQVIRIQDAHRRINFLNKGSTAFHVGTASAKQDSTAMDWEPTRANTARSAPQNQRSGSQDNQTQRRAKWVTREVIEQRKSNRLCIRCGASGHMINSCSVLPARRPQTNVVVATTHIEPLLEEEDIVEDSEKE